MREFLINAGMTCWTLSLCWMWINVVLSDDSEDKTGSTVLLTVLWWVVVIWFL